MAKLRKIHHTQKRTCKMCGNAHIMRIMDFKLPTPNEIEDAAKAARLSMNELCRRAGVSRSVFSRWKNGSGITSGNLQKFIETLDENRVA